jgi:cyclopropane fatty-acyl-phospholipid synthase-like methyltransferase
VNVKKIAARPGPKQGTRAERADRHELYQLSVQNVESEIDFVLSTFKKLRKRKPKSLREDFCGTANTSCEWVRRKDAHRAIGVDIDPEPLGWGREHNVAELPEEARHRVELVQGDVLEVETEKVDCLLAMNFSYWLFMERERMVRYFRRVRENLVEDGVFFLDAYGGYDAFREYQERRKVEDQDFTYVWDQNDYDPISGKMHCFIHFVFPDGSKMDEAFSYTWRLWTLPELQEMLDEAGFSRTTIYWEGTDEETGEGNGEFSPATRGDADAGWIAYIVAER